MNKLFSTPEFPKFPIEEFETELEQEHAEFKSAIQKWYTFQTSFGWHYYETAS